MPIPTALERVGSVLAERYLLETLLARGGMSLLYRGRHLLTGRRVAVKLMHTEGPADDRAERFLREARIAAQLDHPHVVQVLDMGVGDDALFLVMELLEGESLGEYLHREGRLTPQQAVEWLLPIMDALAAAHAQRILHRDVKPANLFLARRGARTVPMLLDFGVAKHAEETSTMSGVAIGTPLYMSPEQARGEREIGPTTDVWSVGMVLYRCLTGELPFRAEGATAVLGRLLTERPPRLTETAPYLEQGLALAVDIALRPDPRDRHPDMRSFALALLPFATVEPELAERLERGVTYESSVALAGTLGFPPANDGAWGVTRPLPITGSVGMTQAEQTLISSTRPARPDRLRGAAEPPAGELPPSVRPARTRARSWQLLLVVVCIVGAYALQARPAAPVQRTAAQARAPAIGAPVVESLAVPAERWQDASAQPRISVTSSTRAHTDMAGVRSVLRDSTRSQEPADARPAQRNQKDDALVRRSLGQSEADDLELLSPPPSWETGDELALPDAPEPRSLFRVRRDYLSP